MSGTRENGWLQKLMYVLIAVLGVYILYKSVFLLLKSDSARQSVESSTLPRNAEDAAVRTYAPGYAAAVEGKDGGGWIAGLMEPLVPVYSYLIESRTDQKETVAQAEADGQEAHTAAGEDKTDGPEGWETSGRQAEKPEEGKTAGSVGSEPDPAGKTAGSVESEPGSAGKTAGSVESEPGSAGKTAGSVESEPGPAGETAGSVGNEPGSAGKTAGSVESEPDPSGETVEVVESESVFAGQAANTVDEERNAGGQVSGGRAGEGEDSGQADEVLEAAGMGGTDFSGVMLEQLRDFNYLLSNYYTLDAGTTIDGTILDADELLSKDLSIQKNPEVPQILIYHTHSQEYFADSVEGDVSMSVVAAGEVLAELLRTKYGYQVIHDTGVYDLVDGVLDRSAAYDYARDAVQQILEENPSIEVVIDLHRDGVDGQKFVTEIDGKPASMIMFFNGLSRDETGAPLTWLDNPYVEDNLAFSLQLQLKARQQYPGYTRNIYLKAERFNLHLRPRSLLIEAGTQLNTVEEEKNAMEPLAELLVQVLEGV